jgi:predicted ATPase
VDRIMLRRIKVSGFRSLSDFDFEIKEGLNVLVGPNGAGKTNIVRLLDFISYLPRDSLSEAVSRAGGAGEIFTKISEKEIERKIRLTLWGHGAHFHYPADSPRQIYGAYQLDLTIAFSELDNRLFYENQRLSLRLFSKRPKSVPQNLKWTVVLDTKYKPGAPIEVSVARNLPKSFSNLSSDLLRVERLMAGDTGYQEYLVNQPAMRFVPFIDKVTEDLSSGSAFNIVPSRVREAEDIAKVPVINPDGSGLAATLFQLRNAETAPRRRPFVRRRVFQPGSFDNVKAFFLLVNPSITGIDVRNDPVENKLKVFAQTRVGDNEIQMPLNFLSDGTIKWLALVTAIQTSISYFAIEEPENFIHPRMQTEFANIARSACEQNPERFALITTHSETLLNALRPEELLIVSMEDGRTVAKRLADPEAIAEEINRTGFGLGYYYTTDAL